ncbi:MAG: pro-sigmaK processing inhibitor BofA family protein [Roseburia sp.]|nr:pro-sigmaK processing inhibitor BofA family protein [Anaeroplasma bactoclasticum]MCM1195727.1 pro-sigmaK processing inhibitor BofA family protein [Roseburia sp.]MCM1556077.1 pro-sigmaK processing inhibitor BofA family protein [Anaeroplasma bactoclasticum]
MLKAIKYILKSVVIGVVSVLVFNLIGQFLNLSLPLNLLSILLIGFFRLPGFIVLLILLVI